MIVTRGMGDGQLLITQGFGLAEEIVRLVIWGRRSALALTVGLTSRIEGA